MNLDQRFPSGSPQRALAEWLDSWATRDWDRLLVASTPFWRKQWEDPTERLRRAYQHLALDRWSVPMRVVPLSRVPVPIKAEGAPAFVLFTDIRCRVEFRMHDEEGTPVRQVNTTIVARLVREHPDGTPAERDDPTGHWYVHPTSMVKGEPSRMRVRELVPK